VCCVPNVGNVPGLSIFDYPFCFYLIAISYMVDTIT
jgi:hypothetical protein